MFKQASKSFDDLNSECLKEFLRERVVHFEGSCAVIRILPIVNNPKNNIGASYWKESIFNCDIKIKISSKSFIKNLNEKEKPDNSIDNDKTESNFL